MFSKFIDKAKPRFSCHPRHSEKPAVVENHNEDHHIFHINGTSPAAAITTHIFGYKDGLKDNYVEPPLGNERKKTYLFVILSNFMK